MATLNIKGLPDPLYRKLKARAKRERRSLAQEVIQLLERQVRKDEPLHSIMELEGLGKIVPEGMTVDQYIRELRDEWD